MWNIEKIVSKGDYNYAVVRKHPYASKHGYVLHHRVVLENHLGRLLGADEVVHHLDGDKKNNQVENLEVLHGSAHSRIHALSKGSAWCVLRCPNCLVVFERPVRQTFLTKGTTYTCCSLVCRGKFSRYIQLHGRTHAVEEAISGNLVREYRKYAHDNPEETP